MTWNYLFTFAQTCLLELPFYALFLGLGPGVRLRTLTAVLALNAVTHPLVFFGFMALKATLVQNILLAELFAFSFEAWACFYFLGLKPQAAILASGLANFVSWQFGPILTYLWFF